MVVEHVFVTTKEWIDATSLASELLVPHGFSSDAAIGFSVDPNAPLTLAMTRSKASLKSLKPTLTPMRLRMGFDRGRVNLAAGMDDASAGGGLRIGGGRVGKKLRQRREGYLILLANQLEMLLVGRGTLQEAAAQLRREEDEIRTERRRDTRRKYIYLSIFLVVVIGLIATLVFTAH